MDLYAILLPLHSVLRWLVLLAGLFAIIRAITGLQFKRPWEKADDRAGLWFTIFMDSQVLIGLILYFFLSPFTQRLLQGVSGAMSDPATRYFGVEHVTLMVVALILAHIGRARSRARKQDNNDKLTKEERRRIGATRHRNAAIFYGLALLALLIGIPWPFLPVGRKLLPIP